MNLDTRDLSRGAEPDVLPGLAGVRRLVHPVLTDHVFHDPLAVRYSLVIVNIIGMSLTIGLLRAGMPAFRHTASALDGTR